MEAFDARNLCAFRKAYPRGKNFVVTPRMGDSHMIRKDGLEIAFINPSHFMESYHRA